MARSVPHYLLVAAVPVLMAVVALAILLAAYYQVPAILQHRLDHSETIGTARLDPPSLAQWPQFSYDTVLSHCDICSQVPASAVHNRTVHFAWLVKDDALAGLVSGNVPNRPNSSADVRLPRLVWVVQWHGDCWSTPPAGVTGCTTYDIIDDASGLQLDTAQAWS